MNTSVADLNQRDQVLITGEDSARFLQGQLTCDVADLNTATWSYGAVCNTKGRVVANFLISQIDTDGQLFLLETEQGMGSLLNSHLSKYAVFYKAEITSVNREYHRWGIISSDPGSLLEPLGLETPKQQGSQIITGNYLVLKLPDTHDGLERMELVILPGNDQPLDLLAGLSIEQWRVAEIKTGCPLLGADTSEKFTPQELNLDLTGAVSFTKGCYTGQEIVARMHYRGKANKRLYFFSTKDKTASDNLKGSDFQLVDISSTNAVNDVFSILPDGEGICGLAVLKNADANNDFVLEHTSGLKLAVNMHALG